MCFIVLLAGLFPSGSYAMIQDHLVKIEERVFAAVIDPDLLDEPLSGSGKSVIRSDIQVARKNALLFVEELILSRSGKKAFRVVEVNFSNEHPSLARILLQGDKRVRRISTRNENSLQISFGGSSRDDRQTALLEYVQSANGFRNRGNRPARALPPPAAGKWFSALDNGNSLRLYTDPGSSAPVRFDIVRTADHNLAVLARLDASLGTQWRFSFSHELSIPLPASPEFASETAINIEWDNKILSDGMLFLPFTENAFARQPGWKGSAGIAIDLDVLELMLLSGLINDTANKIQQLDSETGPGGAGELRSIATIENQLVLAGQYVSSVRELDGSRHITDGIFRTQQQLSSLLFQFPFKSRSGNRFAVTFAPGIRKLFLANPVATWSSSDSRIPVQYSDSNGRFCFSAYLNEVSPVRLDRQLEKRLIHELFQTFHLQQILHSSIATTLPQGQVTSTIGANGLSVGNVQSLELKQFGITPGQTMKANFCASKTESFELIDLYLRNEQGLPVSYSLDKALYSGSSERLNQVTVLQAARLRIHSSFNVVTKSIKSIPVTILAAPSIFTGTKTNDVDVLLGYADEKFGRYRVTVSRDTPSTTLDMATRFVGGQIQTGINYSTDNGKTWQLSKDGLFGFVSIE